MDQNIIQKAKNAVLNTFQNIRSKTINTPLAKNLQSTFYGQGYQAPVQKQLPSLNYFKDLQTGNLRSGIKPIDYAGQAIGSFTQNRIIEPIKAIPTNLRTIKTEAPKIISSKTTGREKINALLSTGIAGLSTVGAVIPFGPEDFAMAGYDTLKARASGKNALKGFTGEEYTGLGEAFKNAPESLKAGLSALELPAVIAAGSISSKVGAMRNARRMFIDNNPKQVSEALSLLRKAEMSYKPTYRKGPNKPSLSISELKKIEDVAQSVIPQVIKNKEMVSLRQSDPSQYYRTLNTFIQEQVVDAFHPELNIGLQAKPQRKLSDFPDLQAKGLTPEVTYKRGDIKNLEKQLDDVLSTDSFMLNNKWTSKFPARQSGLAQLEEGAKAGDIDAINGLKQAEDLIAKLEQARTSSRQSTTPQLSPLAVKPKFQVDPSGRIISEPYLAEPKAGKIKLKTVQQEKARANQDYKEWQSQLFKQENATLTPKGNLNAQLKGIGEQIKQSTTPGGVKASDLKDISGFKSYTRDVYRNFKEVYGNKYQDIKRVLLDPFDQAKGNLSRSYEKWAGRVNNEVEKGLGIMKGSKESAAVQNFGEGKINSSELVSQFGRDKAQKIVEADKWFRKEYNQLLDDVNSTMARIYPNNPEKIIPKRNDYYRHFKEMGSGISGLLNIFDSPSNISSSLAGTSEWVKPRSKWLSFAQKRLGKQTDIDAVGGFLDYVKAAEYNKNIDPFTNQFRKLAEDLAIQTEKDPKLNNFIEYLGDFANDLAGKTNPADRFVQKVVPGGRKTMSVINWANNRVKANTILGNLSSSIAQIFNVPQGIADAGPINATKGLGLSIANIFGESTPIKKSNFITERYGGGTFDRFDRSMIDNAKKGAAWITGVLDEVGTKYIWNSEYAKALSDKVPNPIKFADDATRRMVAGRGIGEVPLIQKSKIFQLVAPFQLEVGNLWHVMGDWVGEKQFGKLATFFIASYVFNQGAKIVRGSDVTFDPIQASIDAYNAYSEEKDKKIGLLRAGGRLSGEVLSNIPLAQSVAGAYPEYGFNVGDTQMPTRKDFFGEGDPTRFGSGLLLTKGVQDPLYKLIPPFGGQQIKRTIDGVKTTLRGYSETNKGQVRFPVEKTPLRNVQRAVFGEYSTPEAREYFDTKASVLGDKQSQQFKDLSSQSPSSAKNYYDSLIKTRANDRIIDTAKTKLKESTNMTSKVGETYLIKQPDGSVNSIDLSPVQKPTATGNTELDKKLFSSYNSKITSQITGVTKLYEAGEIDANKAEELIKQLQSQRPKSIKKVRVKKPKKLTLKKVKTPKISKIKLKKIKIAKVKPIKFKKVKQQKLTKLKTKKIKS